MDRLARSFVVAGATGKGYFPLHNEAKLSGSEIESLLFGREIEGTEFFGYDRWRQRRTVEGKVEHFGYPIHVGIPEADHGISRIEDDMLCEHWPARTLRT